MSTKSEGQLDPGAPPRRKSISGCKCLLFSAITVILLGIGLLFLSVVTSLLRDLLTPHKGLYHNTTLAGVANRATVVQPLVDREQTFDLAATVWLRTSKDGRHRDGVYLVKDKKYKKVEKKEEEGEELAIQDEALVEEPLYSDIIFRGVRLTDKNLQTTVNFTVPTMLFRDVNLTNYDLRGSVMLIPSSPALLDHVTNFSSYIPDYVKVLPVRTWPFPLGSEAIRNKTLSDEVLESLGVSIPLIQFHGIQSQCIPPGNGNPNKSGKVDENADDDEEEEEDLEENPVIVKRKTTVTVGSNGLGISTVKSSLQVTDGQAPLKNHPYIVTRTQIRVLDESKLFSRKTYQTSHKKLKETSCGQEVLVHPNRYFCKGSYRTSGNWETLLQLRVPNKSTGKLRIEWAYGPFIALSRYAIGQKDLLAIPVNRENCTENAKASTSPSTVMQQQDAIDVSWKISYSGRTPAKMSVADMMENPKWYAFNETEAAQIFAHSEAEMANGLAGHRFSNDAHPRRLWVIDMLCTILSWCITGLHIRYWFTRRSTVSISIPGTTLLAALSIIYDLDTVIAQGIVKKHSLFGWIATFLFDAATSLVLPLTQLKAVLRLDISWWNGWIPTVHRVKATHSERASERMEARTTWRTKTGLYLVVVAVYYGLTPHKYPLIAAVTPDPKADDIVGFVPAYLLFSMYIVGNILQITLNWRSRSYAGGYRISPALTLATTAISLGIFVPALVGRVETRQALYAHTLAKIIFQLAFAWQALVLPSVPQVLEEDHIE